MVNDDKTPDRLLTEPEGDMRTVLFRNGKLRVFTRRQLLQMGIGASTLALAACVGGGTTKTSSSPGTSSTKPSGQLNVALGSFGVEAWMPRYGNPQDREVWTAFGDQIYGLNRNDGINLDPAEGIIDKSTVEYNGNKVKWTIKIKKGIPFHDNEGTLTAADVKFTYLDYLKPGLSSSAATKRQLINNNPDNIEVVDDQTLVFNMDKSWLTPHFEYQLCIGFTGDVTGVVPQAYWTRVGDEGYRKHPVSTGPFKFVDYVPGQSITMEAVVPHWRKTPAFERLSIQKVPDAATRLAMLQAGQIDITSLTPLQVQQIQTDKKIFVMHYASAAVTHVQLSGIVLPGATAAHPDIYDSKLPWVGTDTVSKSSVAVRAAMDYAIDRKAIANSILRGGLAAPAVMPFAWGVSGAKWNDPNWKPWPFQPDKARQLMQEAGFPNGFEMSMYIYSDQAPWQGDVMTAVAGYWNKELKIKVNLIQAQYNATVRPHVFDRNFKGTAWGFTDAGYQFPSTTATVALASFGTINYFEVAGFDAIVKQMQGVTDDNQLNALTKQAGAFIYNNHLMHSIVDTHTIWGLNRQKISAWKRTLHRPEMSGLEWVVKA